MKRVSVLGGEYRFVELLERLMSQGKLCVKDLFVLETEYREVKRAYIYIYPIKIYLALTCPYLGFNPTEHREDFVPYCADKNNKEMNPKYCMKLWRNNIPYVLHEICEERGKPIKKEREDMVFVMGRWISKAEARAWGLL